MKRILDNLICRIGMFIVCLLMLTGCTQYDYYYNDRVVVTDGFYKNHKGVVYSQSGHKYIVILDNNNEWILLGGAYLKKL